MGANAFSLYQGDAINLQIPLYASGTTPAALSTPSGTWSVAKSPLSSSVLLTKTATFSKSAAGLWTMTVLLTSTDTAALPTGNLYQQACVGDTDGTYETVLADIVTVIPAIPQSAAVVAAASVSGLGAAFVALIQNLPTAPSASGPTLWSNNGIPTYS